MKAFWVCFRRAAVAMTAFPGNMLTGVCLTAVVNCAVNMTTVIELYKPQKDFGTGLMVSPRSNFTMCCLLNVGATVN